LRARYSTRTSTRHGAAAAAAGTTKTPATEVLPMPSTRWTRTGPRSSATEQGRAAARPTRRGALWRRTSAVACPSWCTTPQAQPPVRPRHARGGRARGSAIRGGTACLLLPVEDACVVCRTWALRSTPGRRGLPTPQRARPGKLHLPTPSAAASCVGQGSMRLSASQFAASTSSSSLDRAQLNRRTLHRGPPRSPLPPPTLQAHRALNAGAQTSTPLSSMAGASTRCPPPPPPLLPLRPRHPPAPSLRPSSGRCAGPPPCSFPRTVPWRAWTSQSLHPPTSPWSLSMRTSTPSRAARWAARTTQTPAVSATARTPSPSSGRRSSAGRWTMVRRR